MHRLYIFSLDAAHRVSTFPHSYLLPFTFYLIPSTSYLLQQRDQHEQPVGGDAGEEAADGVRGDGFGYELAVPH